MPYELDHEKLNSPELKMLDIGNPPTKSIAYQAYPKMLYLHPKDKSKEHRAKVVQTLEEQEEAEAQGYRKTPHIPIPKPEDLSADFEVEEKRGPGRPKSNAA